MSISVEERPVAKKKASESRRLNTPVRMDDEVVALGRKIAGLRGISLGQLFSDILKPALEKEWAKEVRKIVESREGER